MNLSTPVSEMMTKNLVSVKPGQNLQDIKHLFQGGSFHYNLPVIENDALVGMVELNDFMFALKNASQTSGVADYSKLTVREIMREKVKSVAPSATVGDVAGMFSSGEQHTVMVVDGGRLQGIVSSGDVIRWLINGNG